MKRFTTLVILLMTFSFPVHAEIVDISGTNQFAIKGDYLAGGKSGAGVLLLHQCNRDRQMYAPVTAQMQEKGLHTLTIDFRTYGGSQSGEYTEANLEAIEVEQDRREFWRTMVRETWGGDVLAAYDFLRARMGTDRPIGVIGASCGGAQAVQLASKRAVATLSLFSSATGGSTSETYQALPPTPTLFITSEAERPRIQPFFDMATHPGNLLLEYKGEGHGEPLMERDPSLAGTIANWFDVQLKR